MGELARELIDLRGRLRLGGGTARIRRQRDRGKLTARDRLHLLLDPDTIWAEVGLLVAHDRYDGKAPGAGVVTGVGVVKGREVVVVANDATVKAGSWWPETITKILRAQEIAMRCRIPIIYLVDSAGVNLPYQGGVFPGQYGAARIFYYNSIMRRYLRIPQLAAVMGPCIAGGAYLPALSDVILMVEGTSFMGLGGPNLVKGATGQSVDREALGGAAVHTGVSGVAHYLAADDEDCIVRLRALVADLPRDPGGGTGEQFDPPTRPAADLYRTIPDDHRRPYDMGAVLETFMDGGGLTEFQPDHSAELICATGSVSGIGVGVIANRRSVVKDSRAGPPRFGGIIYAESAEKAAYFIDAMNRQGTPIVFVQDVSGFMVGPDAEHRGIIRAGARFVEAMATAVVPKLVVTLNHASGAGYYAMAGQGFDPDFILTLPTGRMGVMEGESAVVALFGRQLEQLKAEGGTPDDSLRAEMDAVRAEYDRQLDATFAAARGFVDAVVLPEELRDWLTLLLRAALNNAGAHIGPFVLPPGLGVRSR
ncbi:MAG: acyl-CoA carboxylase subunit beta [Gemmatimonadetes bacterium]|nr:acyl-CoA carboxylase subunit beta [Gemmatimonadota bacterium]MYB05151.1 acyl-CoA carboxylase subunit beta [Gemmatimonadota bacterium]MYE15048.1 acyl-CoA carboxylase subunit beta [Gemmatimonadota bacterium]MYG24184.1 acyl-CoA carboxylase subunit beta [Gemmatimonadota bacterium]MYJ37922.1 acyl-CoA carboxylase subunit beta [Gemmatimonadota bacterium]